MHSVAWGSGTTASGDYSHAEGCGNIASGRTSHVEGGLAWRPPVPPPFPAPGVLQFLPNTASGDASHAEGLNTLSSGIASHAEGRNTIASGNYSHAQGDSTEATGIASHAEGNYTYANGSFSHSGGQGQGLIARLVASGRTSFAHFGMPADIHTTTEDCGAFADHSAILGGVFHKIKGESTSSIILGGKDNTITSGVTRTAIIGGEGIWGSVSDTVYVPKLNIGTVYTGTSLYNLGINSDGFVVTGTTGGGVGFDWCDPYVMSGNTSGCCIDHLFVTRLSGCSPIYIGGPNRIEATGGTCTFPPFPLGSPPGQYFSGGTLGQGNVNVEGVLNIRNYNNRYPGVNIDLEPNYNPHTQYVLTWNTRPCKIGGTRGDVEYVTKPKFWQYWGKDEGVIEMGTTDTDELIQRYGSTSAITITVTSAGTAQQVFRNVDSNKDRQVKIWIPEESGKIGNAWYADMGIQIQAWSGATTATTQLSSNSISTTGTISANVLSATTVVVGGVSLSACCELDVYVSGASATGIWDWNVSGQSTNYEITLVVDANQLNLTNVRNGDYGSIIIHQDSAGDRDISFGNINGGAATHYVVNGGGGTPTLTANANAIDILSFTYNGVAAFWTVGNDYT
jgi:hypothetical protein